MTGLSFTQSAKSAHARDPSERLAKGILAWTAKFSVLGLKTMFAKPSVGKSWEEIEAGMAEGKSCKDVCGISDERMEDAYGKPKENLGLEDCEGAREACASLCL